MILETNDHNRKLYTMQNPVMHSRVLFFCLYGHTWYIRVNKIWYKWVRWRCPTVDLELVQTTRNINGTRDSVGKFQPGKRDHLFRFSTFSGNFPVGRTDETCSIYHRTGNSGNFDWMESAQDLLSEIGSFLTMVDKKTHCATRSKSLKDYSQVFFHRHVLQKVTTFFPFWFRFIYTADPLQLREDFVITYS